MKFKNITIKNFRSFQGEHSFDFEEHGLGLHDIRGINGAGKSSIFEALFWILYGKTTRNLKAGNVQNWVVKGTVRGVLNLEIDDAPYTITRTWGPNSLTINGRDVDQQEVETLIRLSADAFQHAVLIGQFSVTFFDLAPSPKLAVFSKILDLDVWLQRSIKATEDNKKIKARIAKLENQISQIEGSAAQLEANIEEYEKKETEYEQEQKNIIAGHEERLANTISKIHSMSSSKAFVDNELLKLNKELTEYQRQVEAISNDYKEAESLSQNLLHTMRPAKTFVADLVRTRKEFDNVGADCPNCLQKVPEKYKKKTLSDFDERIEDAKEELSAIVDNIEEANRYLNDIKVEMNLLNSKLRDVSMAKAEKERVRDQTTNNIASLRQEETRLRTYISGERARVNPYTDMLAKADEQINALLEDHKEILAEIDKVTAESEACAFWEKGFKDIRLFVLERALVTLEVEVNNYLTELGLPGWKISFDVEKETKSGTVSRGFVVNIESPDTENPMPWEAWCGGELQRLRIAGALGVANIIRRHAGITDAPLILDEPTQHLHQDGINNLLDMLVRIASTENLQLWFIDHHTFDFGGFSSVTTVEKTENGSKIRTDINTSGSRKARSRAA